VGYLLPGLNSQIIHSNGWIKLLEGLFQRKGLKVGKGRFGDSNSPSLTSLVNLFGNWKGFLKGREFWGEEGFSQLSTWGFRG